MDKEAREVENLDGEWQTPIFLNDWTGEVSTSVDGGSSKPTVVFTLSPEYRAKEELE